MGLRHYSFQQNLQEASQKARAVLQAPVKAVRSVRAAAAQASGAVYRKMPRQVGRGGSCCCMLACALADFLMRHALAAKHSSVPTISTKLFGPASCLVEAAS